MKKVIIISIYIGYWLVWLAIIYAATMLFWNQELSSHFQTVLIVLTFVSSCISFYITVFFYFLYILQKCVSHAVVRSLLIVTIMSLLSGIIFLYVGRFGGSFRIYFICELWFVFPLTLNSFGAYFLNGFVFWYNEKQSNTFNASKVTRTNIRALEVKLKGLKKASYVIDKLHVIVIRSFYLNLYA